MSLAALAVAALGRGGKWLPAGHLAGALALAAGAALGRERQADFLRHPAAPGVAGFLIWQGFSALLSPSWPAAWNAVAGAWAGFAMAFAGVAVWGPGARRAFDGIVFTVCAVQWGLLAGALVGPAPAALLFPGNPQYASLWFVAALGLALDRAGAARRAWGRALFLLAAGIALTGVMLLPVRSGVLASGAVLFAFCWARWGRRGLAAAGAAAVLLLLLAPGPAVRRALKADDPLSAKRLDIWRAAGRGLLAKPFVGWGPGQFEGLYHRHGLPQESEAVRWEMTTAFAHNDYLQAFSETGFPGGLFVLTAMAGLWVARPRRPGIGAAWAGTAVFLAVNFPMVLPANLLLLGGLAARGEPGRRAMEPLAPERLFPAARRVVGGVLAVLAAGQAVLALNSLRPRGLVALDAVDPLRLEARLRRLDEDLHSENGRPLAELSAETEALLRWAPHVPELWWTRGHLRAEHDRPPRLEQALADYRRALALRPHQAPWWMDVAAVMERLGDPPAARQALKEALRNEPRHFRASLAYGNLLRLERNPRAALAWLEGLERRSALWPEARESDSAYRRAVLARDQAGLVSALALARLDLGLYGQALGTLSRLSPGDPNRLSLEAAVHARRGNLAAARASLETGRRRFPGDPRWGPLLKALRAPRP